MTIDDIRARIMAHDNSSAWDKGVTIYALELLDNLDEAMTGGYLDLDDITSALLNGAKNWVQYSYSGCALIYNTDIADRLCTPSELKRNRNGNRNPNSRETWLDLQARALFQAANRILRTARETKSGND